MTDAHRTLRGSGAATRWGAAALGLTLVAALFVPASHTLAISTADDGPSIAPILKRDILVGADMWPVVRGM